MKLVREHINEKFTDESDPIHDMGIGRFEVGDTVKLKTELIVDNRYNDFRFMDEMKFSGKRKIERITSGGNFEVGNLIYGFRYIYPKEMLDLVKKGTSK